VGKSYPLNKSSGAGRFITATALALLGCWTTGYAATINSADCEERSHTIKPTVDHRHYDNSKLHAVDHVPIQDSTSDLATLDTTDPIDNDAATPFLYLTPRVASALREIFDSAEGELEEKETSSTVSSPVAGTDDRSEKIETIEDLPVSESIDDEFDRLIMQRQMFRTDI